MRWCLFFMFLLTISQLQAQSQKDTVNSKRLFELHVYRDTLQDSNSSPKCCSKPENHWDGIQIGGVYFSNLPKAWDALELNWCKSIAFQYNFGGTNIFSSPNGHFFLFTGLGLEYQRLCFDQNSTSITKENGELKLIDLYEYIENVGKIKRSTLKNLYLTVPLIFETQKKEFFVMAGFVGGLRLHSKTKVIYKDEHSQKHKLKKKGNFDMSPVTLDVTARIGYKCFNIWGSYTLTDMFKSVAIHPVSLGIGYTF